MLEHDSMDSIIYLLDFSKLMRNILDSSRAEKVTIKKEIETQETYLRLQKLRFAERFEYTIHVDEEIDIENTSIPPMLLQPFLENAIEHGIAKLAENKKGLIQLSITKTEDGIELQISDNGTGFTNNFKTKNTKHISHAMNITKERIKTINHIKKFKIQQNIIKAAKQGVVVKFKIHILK